MATKYFMNGGSTSNWSDNTNWSTTASSGPNNTTAPTVSDAVILDAGSPAGTIDTTTTTCLSLNCTGYTHTLTFTAAKILTVAGSVTFPSGTGGTCAGTGTLTITGAGTLTPNNNFTFSGALILNYVGNYTLSTTIEITGIVTFSATTILNTGNLFCNGGLTLNSSTGIGGTSAIYINNAQTLISNGNICYNLLIFNYAGIVTLSGAWINNGLVIFGVATNLNYNSSSSETLTCNGGLTMSSATGTTPTATIILAGGTFTNTSTSNRDLYNNLTINPSYNNVTIASGSYLVYRKGILTYTASTYNVITTTSTLVLSDACTLNTDGIIWNNITLINNRTINLTSNLTGTGLFNTETTISTFSGAYNCSFGSMSMSSNASLTLVSGQTYTVTGTFTASGTSGSHITLKSSTATSAAFLKVGTSSTVSYVDATDIDSSGGASVLDTNGSVTRCTNWNTGWNTLPFYALLSAGD